MNQPYDSQPDALEQIFRGPIRWVNLTIIAVNILIFAVTELLGNTEDPVWMLQCGAAYVPLMEEGQWYRLVTSMFLHFGPAHLFNNMFLLLFMGDLLEKLVGKWRYLLILFWKRHRGKPAVLFPGAESGELFCERRSIGSYFRCDRRRAGDDGGQQRKSRGFNREASGIYDSSDDLLWISVGGNQQRGPYRRNSWGRSVYASSLSARAQAASLSVSFRDAGAGSFRQKQVESEVEVTVMLPP